MVETSISRSFAHNYDYKDMDYEGCSLIETS